MTNTAHAARLRVRAAYDAAASVARTHRHSSVYPRAFALNSIRIDDPAIRLAVNRAVVGPLTIRAHRYAAGIIITPAAHAGRRMAHGLLPNTAHEKWTSTVWSR